jgi:hypothetical protein
MVVVLVVAAAQARERRVDLLGRHPLSAQRRLGLLQPRLDGALEVASETPFYFARSDMLEPPWSACSSSSPLVPSAFETLSPTLERIVDPICWALAPHSLRPTP